MPGTFSPPPRVSDSDMHHGTCMAYMPWCMSGSLINGFLWSRWWGKRSRHSRCMRNPQFHASGKRPISNEFHTWLATACRGVTIFVPHTSWQSDQLVNELIQIPIIKCENNHTEIIKDYQSETYCLAYKILYPNRDVLSAVSGKHKLRLTSKSAHDRKISCPDLLING